MKGLKVEGETVSDRLREAMDARGESAVSLAERAGVSTGALSYYLRGKRVPRADVVAKLADALGVRPGWIVTGEGAMRASALGLWSRGLHEVDGLLEDWDRPTGEEAGRVEEEFSRRFARYQGRELADISGTVRLAFGSLLARVMHAARLADVERVEDPAWRGDVAGRLLQKVLQRAREREPAAGLDLRPESTRALLQATAELMGEWENTVGDQDILRAPRDEEN